MSQVLAMERKKRKLEVFSELMTMAVGRNSSGVSPFLSCVAARRFGGLRHGVANPPYIYFEILDSGIRWNDEIRFLPLVEMTKETQNDKSNALDSGFRRNDGMDLCCCATLGGTRCAFPPYIGWAVMTSRIYLVVHGLGAGYSRDGATVTGFGDIMMWRRFAWLVLLVVVWPSQAEEWDHALTEARTVFLRGVDGDKHAVRDALQRFRSLSHDHPEEPVFIAYLGACKTLQGRDAPNNIEKGRLTDEGLHEIDRALERLSAGGDQGSPRYLDTLLVATNTFIHIPSFFNRYAQGKRLLKEILDHPNFDGMAVGFKAAAYMTAALVARGERDKSEYRRYLNLIVSADPEGRDGRLASKLLEEH